MKAFGMSDGQRSNPGGPGGEHRSGSTPAVMPPGTSATDPVCGMYVEPATAAGSATHEWRTYYFCSAHCSRKFQAGPRKYLAGGVEPPASPSPPGEAVYTCPMH